MPCHWSPRCDSHVQIFRNWIIQRHLQNSSFKVNPEADIYMEQRFLTHRRREQPCLLGPFTRPHLEPRLPARPPKPTPPAPVPSPGAVPLAAGVQVPLPSAPASAPRGPAPPPPPCPCYLVPFSVTASLPTLALEPPSLDLSFPFHCSPSHTPNHSPKPSPSPGGAALHRKGPSSVLFTSAPQAHSLAQRALSEPLMFWSIDQWVRRPGGLASLRKEVTGTLSPRDGQEPDAQGPGRWAVGVPTLVPRGEGRWGRRGGWQ